MTEAVLWFLTSPVPLVPTVSWAELAWNVMALVASGFALRAHDRWHHVFQRLTAASDAGARAIALQLDRTCGGLVGLAVLEVLASLPGLLLPQPRPDVGDGTVDRLAMVLVPGVFFAISAGVVWLSVTMAMVTSRIERGRYVVADRRGPPDPAYAGPRRRETDVTKHDGALD